MKRSTKWLTLSTAFILLITNSARPQGKAGATILFTLGADYLITGIHQSCLSFIFNEPNPISLTYISEAVYRYGFDPGWHDNGQYPDNDISYNGEYIDWKITSKESLFANSIQKQTRDMIWQFFPSVTLVSIMDNGTFRLGGISQLSLGTLGAYRTTFWSSSFYQIVLPYLNVGIGIGGRWLHENILTGIGGGSTFLDWRPTASISWSADLSQHVSAHVFVINPLTNGLFMGLKDEWFTRNIVATRDSDPKRTVEIYAFLNYRWENHRDYTSIFFRFMPYYCTFAANYITIGDSESMNRILWSEGTVYEIGLSIPLIDF